MEKEELIDFIKNNLTIDVKTSSEYVGELKDSSALYKDSHTLMLIFCGEVISETYL